MQVYALKKITLAMIFHTKNKFDNFQKLIEILNNQVKKIEQKAEKLNYEITFSLIKIILIVSSYLNIHST